MAEDVLSLIDEASEKAQATADDARQMATVLQEMQQQLASMATDIDASITESANALTQLSAKLTSVEADVTSQLGHVTDSLKKASDRSSATQREMQGSFDELVKQVDAVTKQVDTVTATAAKDSSTLLDILADLDLKEQEFDAQVQSAVEQAQKSVRKFRDDLDGEKGALDQKVTDLTGQYDAVEAEVERRMTALVAEIEVAVQKGRDALNDFEAVTGAAAGKADQAVHDSLTVERAAELQNLCGALTEAVNALKTLTDKPLAMADNDLVEIGQKLQAAVKPLQNISAVHQYGKSLELV